MAQRVSRAKQKIKAAGAVFGPPAEQDRSRWHRPSIEAGVALVERALSHGRVGMYQIQGAIAAVHAEAGRVEETDWPQIVALYGLLQRVAPNPVVTLNRAVAVAMAHGPRAGLDVLNGLEDRLAGHHRLDAVRAHLLEMAGELAAAREAFEVAARRTTSVPERRYLRARAARLRT